ncbi:MAG: hypothetical protein Q4E61_01255 [Alphaproteobacteria bacterium]|nr:hypothetical protein [Alphaproteobacteria bacterium]
MNKTGWELFDIWEHKYYEENDRLGGDSENGNFVEGWCIIENSRFVKTPEDVIGLYLFGYDEHIFDIIDEWKECCDRKGSDNVWDGIELTYDELEKAMEKYFD